MRLASKIRSSEVAVEAARDVELEESKRKCSIENCERMCVMGCR